MFLDFSSIPEVAVSHFKGGQGQALVRRFEDEQGKILILTLPAGSTIGHHVHEDSFEVMHFLSGGAYAPTTAKPWPAAPV